MRRPCLILIWLAAGCGGDDAATPQSSDTDTGTTDDTAFPTSGDGTTMAPQPTSGPTSGTFGSTDSSATAGTSSASTASAGSTSSGASETTGSPAGPRTCKELQLLDQQTPTGTHAVQGPAGPFEIYCDMDTAGGGWTLVGRAVAGVDISGIEFGFFSQTGSLDDDTLPYSLNAALHELEFTQLLVGTYETSKIWGTTAYIIDLPENFLWHYRDAPYFAGPATTVIGDCNPDEGPSQLRWVGWTEITSRFVFSNSGTDVSDGLEADRIDTDANDCGTGANLNDLPGMLFVR